MSNEEIVKEIDEAMESLRETKRKIGGAFSKARNIVIKDSTVDAEAYNKGLEDAWELARKICGATDGKYDNFSTRELCKIFDMSSSAHIINENTYQEALAKLEAYEKEQNEIKVGDVVERNEHKFVIIFVNNEFVNGIDENGRFSNIPIENCKKIGKLIDLTDIFKQIGSDADELS